MKKKVMVLSGLSAQIPLINRLHDFGCEVYDVNLYENSPAFEYADHSAIMNILDNEACLNYARKNGIDAIMSEQCDIATTTIAYVATELGLPNIGNDMARLYTNKFAMREFGIANGIPTPEFKICYSKQEAVDFFNNLGKKIIIKPLDSNSSRGVYTIESLEDLEEHFDATMACSLREKAVLCERYITGTEFTIDGLVTRNGHVCLAISEKHHYLHNDNIADELFFSHKNDRFDYDLLRKTNDKFVNLSGLKFGLTHAEYKFEDGKYYLIEIGARGGGNFISSTIVPIMSGVDNYDYLVKKYLNIEFDDAVCVDPKLIDRCCVLKFFDTPDKGGVVKGIQGLDFINDNSNILDFKLNFEIGDCIEPAKDDAARIGYYIAYADSRDELRALMSKIESGFVIDLE